MDMETTKSNKFEEAMKAMASMSQQDYHKMISKLEGDCICALCPTYNTCAKEKGELLFCVIGKTGCIALPKGCDCLGCPVHDDLGLKNKLYCMKDSEKEMRK